MCRSPIVSYHPLSRLLPKELIYIFALTGDHSRQRETWLVYERPFSWGVLLRQHERSHLQGTGTCNGDASTMRLLSIVFDQPGDVVVVKTAKGKM